MVFYPEAVTNFCRKYPLNLFRDNQITVVSDNSSSVTKPQLPNLLIVPSVEWFGLIWLLWLGGAIALPLLAVSWGWSWIELLLLVSAYSCLIAAAYTYLLSYRTKLLSQYRQQMSEYQIKLATYQKQQIISEHPPEIKAQKLLTNLKSRCQLLSDLMSNRVNPIGHSQARQGVSEEEFMRYLQCYFPSTVQGVQFKIPMSKKSYSADFTIVHNISGIGIDVEVDEPYAGLSLKPTHCWDEDSDFRRNQLFNEWGWIVVRFTEKQVVQAPLSCCKFIAQVIWEVTGDRSYLDLLEVQPDLLPVKPWTTKEARRMAKQRYRKTYLLEQKIEGTYGGIGGIPERENQITVNTQLFGQTTLYYGHYQDSEMRQNFPEADMYMDWAGNGPFYRFIGAGFVRQSYYGERNSQPIKECRNDISTREAVKVIRSLSML